MSEAVADVARCANCQTPLSDAYCAHCGQKNKPLNPRMRELTAEVLGEVTDVDNRFIRSVRYLFTRPGFLSREHAEGRRASYVSPVRLYLIFSVAFFTAASLVAQREGMFSQEDLEEFSTAPAGQDATTVDALEASGTVQASFDTWLPRIMFVLVPLCGLCVMAFTRRTDRHYPEHFHFGLHLHAFWFALFAVTAPFEWLDNKTVSNWMSLGRIGVLLVYTAIAFRTAYGGGWWLSIGRTLGVFVVYMLLVGLAFVAVVGWAVSSLAETAK
jgi:hypothetical protein